MISAVTGNSFDVPSVPSKIGVVAVTLRVSIRSIVLVPCLAEGECVYCDDLQVITVGQRRRIASISVCLTVSFWI